MPPRFLKWSDIMPNGGVYHVGRSVRRAARKTERPHTHDFYEVFWLDGGTAQHAVNGQRIPIDRGECVFIRATDVHAWRVTGDAEMTMTNVAFSAALLSDLRERLFNNNADWPWHDGDLPRHARLRSHQLDRLRGWADRLAPMRQERYLIEAFLLDLICQLTSTSQPISTISGGAPGGGGGPEWLSGAIEKFVDPEHIGGSASDFAALCHRTPEHVSRVVRGGFGKTTTDLINDLRLDVADRALRMSDRPIVQIALDAGFENLSYFYRRFRRRFDTTPRQRRLEARATLG